MRLLLLPVGLMLAACQPTADVSSAAVTDPDVGAIPMLVTANCAGCHAVGPNALSPLVEARSFVDIANMPGLTRASLATFLSDAHNYPDVMDVELDDADVLVVTDYLLTLRDESYRPGPS